MRFQIQRSCCSAALAGLAAILLLASTQHSFADTYSLTVIEHTDKEAFIGIDNLGDFIVNRSNTIGSNGQSCGGVFNASTCYQTFYASGGSPVFTVDAPKLAFDDGSACTPALAGFSIASGVCNSGHYLAAGVFHRANGTDLRGIWGGPNPDPVTDYLSNGFIAGAYMNASGDAVFIDTYNNTLVFANDLSTDVAPEPSTLALLGTGVLALVDSVRRRLSR